MKKTISTILILGMISSISCTSFANEFHDQIFSVAFGKPDCHFQLKNLDNSSNENSKCNSFISNIKEAIGLMKKNTGLTLTSNATIDIYESGTPGANIIEKKCGGGGYTSVADKIFLSEKNLENEPKTVAHEMTHAELCNRLKTCKKNSLLFPYKHSQSFEEGITSQNNPEFYNKENVRTYTHNLSDKKLLEGTKYTSVEDLCNHSKRSKLCKTLYKWISYSIDKENDKVYSDEYKQKLIFAPVSKGGGASYAVHRDLISNWKEKYGENVIEDMIDAVNEKNILPEEQFLQNGGEQVILDLYGEKGLKYAKRNIRSLKIRSLSKYALIPLLALIIDREIRADVNSIKFVAKLPKTIYAKLKAKFSKKDSANLKVESQQCNETVDQTKVEEVLSENPADLSDSNVDENLNLENNSSAAENSCTSEEGLSENPADLSDSNLDENLNLENNSSAAENSCTSEEVLSENPADLSDSNVESAVNAVTNNKNSCKQLFKNVVKYRGHEILLAAAAVLLYEYCQQEI